VTPKKLSTRTAARANRMLRVRVQATETMTAGHRRGPWDALLAGTLGGALAGAVDVAVALAHGVGGLSAGRTGWLMALAVGACALAGTLLAAVAAALAALATRLLGYARGRVTVALLLVGPLVIYDAFALFRGEKAAKVPGHLAISIVLAAGALVCLAIFVGVLLRLAERRRGLAALALALAAAGCHAADRIVLPRLYPWFHATLSFLFLAALVGAVRLALGQPGKPSARLAAVGPVIAAAVATALFVVSLRGLVNSQFVRYAAHERTRLTALVLSRLPLPHARSFIARTDRQGSEASDEPLPEGPHRPNADVILITIDALRSDHVGAYGYPRATTPNIDALAARGVRFVRTYSQAPHTSFSVASMLTGKYYPTIARLAPGDPHDPIAAVLRRYGWKTAAFYPPAVFFVDAHKLKAYEDTNFSFEYVKFEFLDAFKRLDQIESFFTQEKPGKTFLWLHLFEPHEPYDERPGHSFGHRDLDRYDSEIAYTDAAVGKLLAYLTAHRPGAVVILTADHGEEFDEHSGRYHGSTLFEEQIRVPLIIAVPGVVPHVVEGPVELIDLTPTILGLLDIPIPARMRGTDLGPWLAAPPASNTRLPPAFAEVGEKRMVVSRTDKLICELNWGYCSFYDLRLDPREQKNLAEEQPERAAGLKRLLDDWLDDHVRFEPQLVRGLANPAGGEVPRAIERGRLGDLGAVADLAALLRSSQPVPVRREAARLLVALPPRSETRAGVLAGLDSDDREVRWWAAVAATRLGDTASQERLRTLVAAPDADPGERDLRVQAALALAYRSDRSGVPVLAEALDHCEQAVLLCQLIIQKLGGLRDPRAVPALLRHLPEVQNRREMVDALGDIADPRVGPVLVERLRSDEYVTVRAQAATALAKIGGPAATAGLLWSLRHEREPSVLVAARAALAALAPAGGGHQGGAVENSTHSR
jgi:arylsulfatase A-like enzyme